MDGIWVSSMSFSLALAEPAKMLGKLRPTASLFGPNTMWSYCGTLAINFLFLVIGLASLFAQPWFQCRKWDSSDVSNVTTIGDNYETSVIFIISGYQYISSAAAFNFGYSFRQSWIKNYVFVLLFVFFTAMQFSMVLTSSHFSCIWRVNCDLEHAVRYVTNPEPQPMNNNFATTVMPVEFRGLLFVLCVANLIVICIYNYFIVNRFHKKSDAETENVSK
jgi:cation-transporting ATPase 13A3/4/5